MNVDASDLLGRYLDWLRQESTARELDGGWTELTLPFLDRHNDYLRVYVQAETGGLRITDGGETFRDLRHDGCNIEGSPRRKLIAERILRNFGVELETTRKDRLSSFAANGDFASKLHNVFLSMMALDGLAHVAPSTVAHLFEEDVAGWLRANTVEIGASHSLLLPWVC